MLLPNPCCQPPGPICFLRAAACASSPHAAGGAAFPPGMLPAFEAALPAPAPAPAPAPPPRPAAESTPAPASSLRPFATPPATADSQPRGAAAFVAVDAPVPGGAPAELACGKPPALPPLLFEDAACDATDDGEGEDDDAPAVCTSTPVEIGGDDDSTSASRGTARLASTRRPSMWWSSCFRAHRVDASVTNVTKPKPRDRRSTLSRITTAEDTRPYAWKYCRRFSSVVSNDSPPTNNLVYLLLAAPAEPS